MNTHSKINISHRAYAALLASCARSVLAHDARPILASDIEPLLRGDWKRQRYAVEHALAYRLRGNLASDSASSEKTAQNLMAMIGDEPDKQSEYDEKMFGTKPTVGKRDSQIEPDATDDAAVAKNGFVKGEDKGDPVAQVMQLVADKLSPEDCEELQQFLAERLGGDDDEIASDDPPAFSGQPTVGGKLRPLSAKSDTAGDRRLTRQAAQDSFNRRFPEVSRITGAASPVYSDGTPVPDARLLGGSTPAPRKSAMDAAPRRQTQSFEQRFPEAARIRSA